MDTLLYFWLSMQQTIKKIIQASIDTKQQVLNSPELLNNVEQITNAMVSAFQNGNKVLFCGNGGSAADAQHLAAEFSGRFYSDRDPLPSEALHCNTSFLTAVANDYGYDVVYSRIVKGMGKKGDVLVGLSTSGNSVNIVNAMTQAKELGMITVGFTGEGGGKMKAVSDFLLDVPSKDTPRIQETHITLGHIICQLVEQKLF
ncbi:MAG: phosphoheptose isomerase [Flavipsychrobacter sp.]|jgi:D-sedoheptulose 7-phosphate isomerase|nr:phosphoheptose isomerase [Flavipsychrobacter sp.]